MDVFRLTVAAARNTSSLRSAVDIQAIAAGSKLVYHLATDPGDVTLWQALVAVEGSAPTLGREQLSRLIKAGRSCMALVRS